MAMPIGSFNPVMNEASMVAPVVASYSPILPPAVGHEDVVVVVQHGPSPGCRIAPR